MSRDHLAWLDGTGPPALFAWIPAPQTILLVPLMLPYAKGVAA